MSNQLVRRRLIAYAAAMTGGMVGVQAVIAAQNHRITLVSQLALAVVAIGYIAFYKTQYRVLRRVPYALITSHAIGYAIVNGSFWVHATYLWSSGQGARIDAAWYGSLIGMAVFWGIGLAIHGRAAHTFRGLEEAAVA